MERKPLLGGYPLVLLDVVRFATARAAATLSGVVALVAAASGARAATSFSCTLPIVLVLASHSLIEAHLFVFYIPHLNLFRDMMYRFRVKKR